MLVSLSPQSEKKGERMSSVMNYRRGGRLQEMITRTVIIFGSVLIIS